MFLTQSDLRETSTGQIRRANQGDPMTNAADLFSRIEEFLRLSRALSLTLPEEQTLVSLDAEEWERWRSMSVPPGAFAPSLLVRRLDYAIDLLNRMVAASAPGGNWSSPNERRF